MRELMQFPVVTVGDKKEKLKGALAIFCEIFILSTVTNLVARVSPWRFH